MATSVSSPASESDRYAAIIRARLIESGIDNFAFVADHLKIGSVHYRVEPCRCGEGGCDGVRLRPLTAARRTDAIA